jgi:peptidoglycan/xylan/chitin deacetylase (PgdA/CDA1 family)
VFEREVPFNERGGALRGCVDLVSGRFPRFVFGGGIGRAILPVFHFHDETADNLEPKLRYLTENGYRSVTCDEIADFVAGRGSRSDRLVGLCFDDAWASLWTVAAPLLKAYGHTAIVYAIPGRTDRANAPFVTAAQLRELQTSGVADVQCHTYSHARVFCSTRLTGFVTPDYAATPLLNRPLLATHPEPSFVTDRDLGAPLYPARSRMSDGRRVLFTGDVHRECVDRVAREGGAAFFDRPGWRAELEAIAARAHGQFETEADQESAIEDELDRGRSQLNQMLGTNSVQHVCLPWGVSGARTERALRRLGYRTAFANRLRGQHAVARGDDPLWLKRLPNKYILHLPGRGRRTWL